MALLLIFFLILITAFTIRFMVRNIPGSQVMRHIWVALAFGVLAISVAIVLEVFTSSLFGNDSQTLGSLGNLPLITFAAFIGVGLIEEFAKFFPFSRYLRSKPYFNKVADSFVYFAIIGMTFGALEDVEYTVGGGGSKTLLLRLTLGLFFHAALCSIVGFYFARSYALRQNQHSTIAAYLVVAGLHGVYDYSLAAAGPLFFLAWAVTVAANCYMFWLYYKANVFDFQLRTGHLPQEVTPGYAMMAVAAATPSPVPVAQPTPMPASSYQQPMASVTPSPQPPSGVNSYGPTGY